MRHFIFTFIFMQLSAPIIADTSYWDAKLVRSYVHNSELQRRWAMSYVAPYLKLIKGNEQILDFGCGDGRITADISKFVPTGSVLGIDLSQSMIDWAQKQYHASDYPNLMFQIGSFLEPNLQTQFDLIVSFCALLHCSNQKQALTNLGTLLKPNGKLLVLIPAPINNAWIKARSNTQAREKWSSYWQNIPPKTFYSAHEYTALLEQAGLECAHIETIPTMDPFIDKDEIIDWLSGTFFIPGASTEKAREFYNEWIDEYIRLVPEVLQPDGVIYVRFGYITIEAKRKSL